jgi:hypothetical protein
MITSVIEGVNTLNIVSVSLISYLKADSPIKTDVVSPKHTHIFTSRDTSTIIYTDCQILLL